MIRTKNVKLLLDPVPIKSPSDVTNVLHSIFTPGIKEVECSDSWNFGAHHCEYFSYLIQDIEFDQSYIPEDHSY